MSEQPPAYPPQRPAGYPQQQPTGTNGMAIASLVCSLIGLVDGRHRIYSRHYFSVSSR